MKNNLWLYKKSYQIEIREKEVHPPQVAVYLYEAEEEIKFNYEEYHIDYEG